MARYRLKHEIVLLKMFSDNVINRSVCLLLIVILLATFPTGASSLTFCLDQEENHIVGQNYYLANCHTANETSPTFSEENCSALFEGESSDCNDVSLASANILYRPSKLIMPISAKLILFYTFPRVLVSFHQQAINYRSSALYKELFGLPQFDAQRTVVLLI
jgi:hypothetical protein